MLVALIVAVAVLVPAGTLAEPALALSRSQTTPDALPGFPASLILEQKDSFLAPEAGVVRPTSPVEFGAVPLAPKELYR